MKSLKEFLNSNVIEGLTKEVAVSKRFKGDDGELFKFKIKTLTKDRIDELKKKAMLVCPKEDFRAIEEMQAMNIIIDATIEPNFKDAESHKVVGAVDAESYINKVLLPGEILILGNLIYEFCGFGARMDELVEEAKN